jgi:cytochrome P450
MEQTSAASKGPALTYRSLPSPSRIPVLGNAHQIDRHAFHQQLEAWSRQYGGRFRFQIASRKFMAISDPDAIASVLRQRPQVFKKTPRLVQVARDLGFPGVFTANDDAWRRQRQLVMPAFDPAHLRRYLPLVIAVTERLRARWLAKAKPGEEIDLLQDLMRFTVDVTTALAFGEDLHTLEQGDDVAIQRHLNFIFPKLMERTLAPVDIQHWWKDRPTTEHVEALRQAVQKFIRNTRQRLEERPELRDHPENLIQSLVATRDAGAGLTDDDVSGNVLTMLLAGEDTTANTLAWLIWLLRCNPAALATARSEVESVVGRGALPDGLEQLSRLDFVEACTNEAMRLKPVAPLNMLQAGEDVVLDGVAVPKGIFVVCLMRPAGMDPARFEAPETFRPERWLHPEGEGSGRMFAAKRVVMPFGGGPRLCPGRYLALAEIKIVLGMLLANFDIQDVSAGDGEPRERLALTMSPVGLRMKVQAHSRA